MESESIRHSDSGASGKGTSGFVDIHCHCLWAIDDGPIDIAESVQLCRALVADGIETVVATPHQLGRWEGRNSAAEVREAVGRLSDVLAEEKIELQVRPGGDVRVDERIGAMIDSDEVMTLADAGRCILLELPHEVFIDIEFLLVELKERSIQAVISHPERNSFLKNQPDAIAGWAEYEPCLQVTAGSLGGLFGRRAQQAAWYFLDMPFPLVVATDSHNTVSRAPCMSQAFDMLAGNRGEWIAQLLCRENPQRIIRGEHALMVTEFAKENEG